VRLLFIVYAAILLTGGITQIAMRLHEHPCAAILGLMR
jgi:hypothetical protein